MTSYVKKQPPTPPPPATANLCSLIHWLVLVGSRNVFEQSILQSN